MSDSNSADSSVAVSLRRCESGLTDTLSLTLARMCDGDLTGHGSTVFALVEAMPVGVLIAACGPEFRVVAVSACLGRLAGKATSVLCGVPAKRYVSEFGLCRADGSIPGDELSPIWRAVNRAEHVEDEEWVVQRPDGTRIVVSITAVPLVDAQHTTVGAIETWRDVTHQKRSEGFADVMNEINEKIHRANDIAPILSTAMRAGARALGAETAAVSLRDADDWQVALVHGFPQSIVGAKIRRDDEPHAVLAIESNRPVAIEDAFTDPRTNNAHMKAWNVRSVLVVPLVVGGEPLGVMFFNSHTRGLKFDSLALEFAHRLGTKLALAVQNAEAMQKLRNTDALRLDFLALLSHELRNPLAPIKNSLLLLDKVPPAGEQAARAKATLNRQVQLLTRLVDDLSEVTRLTTGKLRLERTHIDLAEVIPRIADDNRSAFEKVELKFVVSIESAPVVVNVDVNRLYQAISNLLMNSAKFTPAGGRVTLRLRRVASAAVVSVHDTGIGLDPSSASKLFQPFVQSEASIDKSKKGLGLGLALVKGIAELHGGSVEANSQGVGTGSEFVIRLPIDEGPEPETRSGPTSARLRTCCVLVVDDDADSADTLCELLVTSGQRAHAAYGGADALSKAEQLKPDLVLTDIEMPGMDGYALLSDIRARTELRSTCVVAVTGYADAAERRRAIEAGFHAYLRKPVHLAKLMELLENLPRIVANSPHR